MENQFWKTYSLVAGSVWDLGRLHRYGASAIYNFNEYVAFGAGLIQIPKTTLRLICMEEVLVLNP
jgi:hypothetical protein